MKQTTLSLLHPIIFLFDPSNRDLQVPEYFPGIPTAASDSCVSVSTQSEVDGDVTICMGKTVPSEQKAGCKMIFRGDVRTPGRRLAVVTAEYNAILDTDVQNDVTTVTISVDDSSGATRVVVELQ